MVNLRINFNPIQKNVDEISFWGTEKSCLYKSYKNKTLIVAECDNVTIGFFCLTKRDKTIHIDTAEIKEEFKLKGIGRLVFEEISKNTSNKFYGFTLNSTSENSHSFWLKLGFIDFPIEGEGENRMVKNIRKTHNQSKRDTNSKDETIEIYGNNEVFKFNLDFINGSRNLKHPIFLFGDCRWRIVWKKGNITFFDDTYKYFNAKQNIYDCLFIKSLPIK
ncbi:GNAT family N-acetyltransferase [Epilithonimonas hispanica]|uniref:N-acetyltransferase domain-containing protein n=1 Tax=Epilithonimonas hispanica TaxID=358687 RepID=A0A3D9CTW5_9FLAO|nr:GNAT family N-acetyltransferase [Epilithonimonas hispanica]REC69216.1 hypothetical protein DRF58_12780 [Epilithonimonas hispanica]